MTFDKDFGQGMLDKHLSIYISNYIEKNGVGIQGFKSSGKKQMCAHSVLGGNVIMPFSLLYIRMAKSKKDPEL